MKKISNKFHQGALTVIILLLISVDIALKLDKISYQFPIFMYKILFHVQHPKFHSKVGKSSCNNTFYLV